MRWVFAACLLLLTMCAFRVEGLASGPVLRIAVTTSFENSGLSGVLLPEAERDLGADIQIIVVGTGQALKLGAAGDVDAVLVHSKAAEQDFVADGNGLHRTEIMFNDFVLVGPATDPAEVVGKNTVSDALMAIFEAGSIFVSRGDDSGTHQKERELWNSASVTVFDPGWYRETGSGMGAALNTAVGLNAYTLSDRATWLKFGNKATHAVLYSSDPVLENQYAYLPVNPSQHPHIATDLALAFEEWLVSTKGQSLINGYRLAGEQLFTANAKAR